MIDAVTLQFAAVVERDMRLWLERAVIGLNLCPFAKAVHARGQIHYAVSRADEPDVLLRELVRQLQNLVASDPAVRDTTLLMAPDCLRDFLDFNAFLGRADRALLDLELQGVVQIASFHPEFQFANTAADDITNFTNRAPYPTLHLLREASVDRAVRAFPQADAIYRQNMRTMEKLGPGGWEALGLRRASAPEQHAPTPPLPGRTRP